MKRAWLLRSLLVLVTVAGCGGKPSIRADCAMNGLGSGDCNFTNTGDATGSVCGKVEVYRDGGGRSASGTLCSGEVAPATTTTVSFNVSGVRELCAGTMGRPWTEVCAFAFFEGSTAPEGLRAARPGAPAFDTSLLDDISTTRPATAEPASAGPAETWFPGSSLPGRDDTAAPAARAPHKEQGKPKAAKPTAAAGRVVWEDARPSMSPDRVKAAPIGSLETIRPSPSGPSAATASPPRTSAASGRPRDPFAE